MTIPGWSSTGSKRPELVFGSAEPGVAARMISANGCRIVAEDGREYLDFIMALGAVALGYGHPLVTQAAVTATMQGGIGTLAPALEVELAEHFATLMPWIESIRFLKTGAEAAAAAVRIARVATGRDLVLGCGYHGWLDWCSRERGVPDATKALYAELPFNDAERTRAAIRAAGDRLAAVIFEPVIGGPPAPEWLDVIRQDTRQVGAVVIVDEIKTAGRLALGGATERWRLEPDLVVLGKAIANGFPLAAVGGGRAVMEAARATWISSTMATEFIALAACRATLGVLVADRVPERLDRLGGRLYQGLERLSAEFPTVVDRVAGMPVMCHLEYRTDAVAARVTHALAERGILFKRSAFNFVSAAHREDDIDRCLAALRDVLGEVRSC